MAYTSVSSIKSAMRKLPSSITNEEITYHIEQASALIDSKLGEVMSVPLTPTPPLLEKIATDLTIFFLAENLYSSNMPNLDETYVRRYERAMSWLGDMVDREAEKQGSDCASTTEDCSPIFTFDEPEW
jgi:phage gp36-like protein